MPEGNTVKRGGVKVKKKGFLVTSIIIAILFCLFQFFRYDLFIITARNSLGAEIVFGLFHYFVCIVYIVFTEIAIIYGFVKLKAEKWKAFIPLLICMVAISTFLIIPTSMNPEAMSVKQVTGFTKSYFQRKYGMDVIIKDVNYIQISEHEYRNSVTVSSGGTEYNLSLNKHNKPEFDDVHAVEVMGKIDKSLIEDKLKSLGLEITKYSGYNLGYSYEDKQYIIGLSVSSIDRPSKNAKDDMYSLLELLKEEGVDKFSISVPTPDFLTPQMEFGYGAYGSVLGGENFETDMDMRSFEEKYYGFVDSIYWDEQKFDDKIIELEQLGYKNVHFFIPMEYNSNTIRVLLYCEADSSLSYEQANDALISMDESYFEIQGYETVFVLSI